MLTLFSIPKPFSGHIGIIQTNAILSWKALHPDIDILIVGNEDGVEEFCAEHDVRHIGNVERNSFGTPLLSSIFRAAEEYARFPVLTYINADIILFPDFPEAVSKVPFRKFLLGGRRLDCDWEKLVDFSDPVQITEMKRHARENGVLRGFSAIDYFAFPRGLYGSVPDFAIGRVYWDNWLLFRARQQGAPLINATGSVFAIHQNHDYRHATATGTMKSVWNGPEAFGNRALIKETIFTLREADWKMTQDGLRRNFEPSLYRVVNEAALQIDRHLPSATLRRLAYRFARQMWDRNWRTRYGELLSKGNKGA